MQSSSRKMVAIFTVLLFIISVVFGDPPEKFGGRYLPGGRIVGGENADIADYPYQLCLIFQGFGPFCGAALISPNWALTAAHCTLNTEASDLSIRAGSSISTSGGQVVYVETIFQHKDFNYDTGENDISLLKLGANVTIVNAKEIALANKKPETNKTAIVTGWGLTDENDEGLGSEVLQVIEVPIVDQEECQKVYVEEGVTDSMFCAGLLDIGGKDACKGDSGGPLTVDGILAGVVSWGTGCAQAGKPGVYTNVARYLEWIDEIMSSES